jgi:transcriptional regulator with XRE-family HTH domain
MSRVIITEKQCRAARELLGWKQTDLCKASKITQSTIADFERGVRELRMGTLESIVTAFEKKGIRFENNNSELVVRLVKK